MEQWGKRLERLRKELGFVTQTAYSAATGLDVSILSKMEGGKYYNPKTATLGKLAAPLDMTASELSAYLFEEGSLVRNMTLSEILHAAYMASKEVTDIVWFDVYEEEGLARKQEGEVATGQRIPYVVPEGTDPKFVRAYRCNGGCLPCLVQGGTMFIDHAAYRNAEPQHGQCVEYIKDGQVGAAWVQRLGDTTKLINNKGAMRLEDVEVLGRVLPSIIPVDNPNI